jgi:hypothetical protein
VGYQGRKRKGEAESMLGIYDRHESAVKKESHIDGNDNSI